MEQPPTYYTIAEAHRELRISRSTLNRFLGDELPVTRFGRSVRIHRDDLDAFQLARRQQLTGDDAGHSAA